MFNKISCLLFQHYRFIEIAIKQCRQSGIDCKIHGLSIIGRYRSDEDSAASFSYLASDQEEEADETRPSGQHAVSRRTKPASKEVHTHVFTWGLNDKDQLGGPKGSKVRYGKPPCFNSVLAFEVHLQITLFCMVFNCYVSKY